MNRPKTHRLAANASVGDTSSTSAIVHIPQSVQTFEEAGSLPLDTLPLDSTGLGHEVIQQFQQCYRRFVGYPADDFQPPAHTRVRYSLLQHFGKQPWETPGFKAGMAGFGSIVTVFSVGYLLSEQAPNPLASDPLNYTLPPDISFMGDDAIAPESLHLDLLAVGDAPSTIDIIEFSHSSDT
jgi:hypothetical protein